MAFTKAADQAKKSVSTNSVPHNCDFSIIPLRVLRVIRRLVMRETLFPLLNFILKTIISAIKENYYDNYL